MPVLNIRQHIVANSLGLTVISTGLLLASPAMALTAEEVNPIYQTNFTEDQGISPGQNPGSYAYYFDTKRPNKIINALGFAVFDDWTPFNYPQGSTYDIYIWKYVGDSTGDVVFTPLLANPITFDVNYTSTYVFKDGFYWIPTEKINLGSETFSDPLTGFAVSAVGDFGSEVTGLPILLNGSGSFAPQFAWDGSGLNGPGSYFYPEFPLPLDYEGLFPTDRYGYFNANASFDSPGTTPDDPLMPVIIDDSFVFEFPVQPNVPVFIDPPVTIGYNYTVTGGPLFNSVTPPTLVNDNLYDLFFSSDSCSTYSQFVAQVTGNTQFNFASPQSCFSIRDIAEAANLSPTDPAAFVTGVTFDSAGLVLVTQTPINVPGPLPVLGVGAALGWTRRLRTRVRQVQQG